MLASDGLCAFLRYTSVWGGEGDGSVGVPPQPFKLTSSPSWNSHCGFYSPPPPLFRVVFILNWLSHSLRAGYTFWVLAVLVGALLTHLAFPAAT